MSIESHRRQEDGGAVSDEPARDKVATGLPAGIDRKLATVMNHIYIVKHKLDIPKASISLNIRF